MRTQWTAKGNRDSGSSCLCDRGLHRNLRNFGGGGLKTPNPPRYATAEGSHSGMQWRLSTLVRSRRTPNRAVVWAGGVGRKTMSGNRRQEQGREGDVRCGGQGEADDRQNKASSCGASKIVSWRIRDVFWKQICQGKTELLCDGTTLHRLITAPDLRSTSTTREMPEQQQVRCYVQPDACV